MKQKTNPENFDDGLTKVAPKGEFNSEKDYIQQHQKEAFNTQEIEQKERKQEKGKEGKPLLSTGKVTPSPSESKERPKDFFKGYDDGFCDGVLKGYNQGIEQGSKDINCQDCNCCKAQNHLCHACLSVLRSDIEKESIQKAKKEEVSFLMNLKYNYNHEGESYKLVNERIEKLNQEIKEHGN